MSLLSKFAYSNALTLSNVLFPLLTFPYITRTLGPENIGAVAYIQGITDYFILIAALGINIYGQRAIAQSSNKDEIFNELFTIQLLMSFIMSIALLVCAFLIPNLQSKFDLLIIGSIAILFSGLNFEWFFRGVENFKFITIRTLLIRSFTVFLTFVLVTSKEDKFYYYLITLISIVLSGLVNFYTISKILKVKTDILNNIRKAKYHIKNLAISGFYMIITNLYSTLPLVYLGYIISDAAVGNFTIAIKIYMIFLTFFTAITSVIFPRASNLIAQDKMIEFSALIEKSIKYTVLISLPIAVYVFLFSRELIDVIAGSEYKKGIVVLEIVSILIFVLAIAKIFVSQILFPLKKDSMIIKLSLITLLVGVLLNYFLVKRYEEIGTAIAVLISETFITLMLGYSARKYFSFIKLLNSLKLPVFISTLIFVLSNLIHKFLNNELLILVFSSCVSFFMFIAFLKIFKDPIIDTLNYNFKKLLLRG